MTYLVHELEELGHECRIINGEAVKDYVKSHFAGQKNDLNDAQAICISCARRNAEIHQS